MDKMLVVHVYDEYMLQYSITQAHLQLIIVYMHREIYRVVTYVCLCDVYLRV